MVEEEDGEGTIPLVLIDPLLATILEAEEAVPSLLPPAALSVSSSTPTPPPPPPSSSSSPP